jgi:Trypsin
MGRRPGDSCGGGRALWATPKPFWGLAVALGAPAALVAFPALGLSGSKLWDIDEREREPAPKGGPLSVESAPSWPAGHDGVVALAHQRGVMCTGALIRADVVITAAHCRNASHALAGAYPASRLGRSKVARFVTHPSRGVDLGLAFLEAPLPGPIYPFARKDVLSGPGRFVGYGCEDDRSCVAVGRRKYFNVTLQPQNSTCSFERAPELGCAPTTEMVLPRAAGADTCRGDSGGPLLVASAEGWLIQAITSRGLVHAERRCGEGGIYVRTAPQTTWLQAQLKAHKPPAPSKALDSTPPSPAAPQKTP